MRIVAEVVRTWFTAVGSGQEMRTQQAAVETQRRSLELLLMRHAVGDASLADVDAAQARLAAAAASLPGIRARERAAGFRLAALLGAPPEYGLHSSEELRVGHEGDRRGRAGRSREHNKKKKQK